MDDLISRLSELRCQYNCVEENERDAYHTLSEAIKALSDVPDTNVGDMISRQAAIDAILHNQEVYSNNFGNDPIDKYTIAIIDNDAQTIAQLPSAQPKIIRCKDCLMHGVCRFEQGLGLNGYCSQAERREE